MSHGTGGHSLEDAARDACARAGLEYRSGIPQDGHWHRLNVVNDRRGQDDGAIKLFTDGEGGIVWNWKTDYYEPFFRTRANPPTEAELAAQAKVRREAEQERERARVNARGRAKSLWEQGDPVGPAGHPYLTKKGVGDHGIRVIRGMRRGEGHDDTLVIPVWRAGELITVQLIGTSGVKRFLKHSTPKGGHLILNRRDEGPVLIAEGFATSATLAEITRLMCVCAFSRGGLLATTQAMQEMFPGRQFIICGDYDRDGIKTAGFAAQQSGALLAIPDFSGVEAGKGDTDFNDLARLAGNGAVLEQIRAVMKAAPLEGGASRADAALTGKGRHADHQGGDDGDGRDMTQAPPANKGESRGSNEKNAPSGGNALSALDCGFDGELPLINPPQLIKRILPRAGLIIMGGQSGAGKTFMAIHLALSLASGQACFGYPVRERVGVIYIAAEGRATIGARLAAAKLAAGIEGDLPICVIRRPPMLNGNPELFQVFAQQLRILSGVMQERYGVRVGAVMLDTVSAAITMKDENDNAEVANVCACLRLLGDACSAVTIAVHHFGKEAERGLRGATAWKANADHCLSVLAERDEATGKVEKRSLNIIKNQVGEEGPVSGFELPTIKVGVNQYEEDEFSCWVKSTELPPIEQRQEIGRARYKLVARQAVYEALMKFPKIRSIYGDGPQMRCVTMRDVHELFLSRWVTGDGDPNSKSKFNQWKKGVEYLNASGEFGKETDRGGVEWVWLVKSEVEIVTKQSLGDFGDGDRS